MKTAISQVGYLMALESNYFIYKQYRVSLVNDSKKEVRQGIDMTTYQISKSHTKHNEIDLKVKKVNMTYIGIYPRKKAEHRAV